MDKRISLRPVIENAIVDEHSTNAESFQNSTLRPIIKMQHPLLLAFVSDHVLKVNKGFLEVSDETKRQFLKQLFSKDTVVKNRIIGIVVGQFTVEEFEVYSTIDSEVNKRIIAICEERVLTHLNEIK